MLPVRWPSQWISLPNVEGWIGSELQAQTVGLEEVLGGSWSGQRSDDAKWWSLTARFRADASVAVFKAAAGGLYPENLAVHRLVSRHLAGRVPDLLAARDVDDQVWLIFEFVEGHDLFRAGLEDVARVTEALADLQACAASLDLSELPLVRPSDLLDLLLEDGLEDQPESLVRWLGAVRPQLRSLAEEVETFPLSLDHTDVNPWNARIRPDGRVVFIDWEETIVSAPFFSLERVLSQVEFGDDMERIAEIYVGCLPWGAETERWSALNATLALNPLKIAYEARQFARRLGWDDPHSTWTAELLADARDRTESLQARPPGVHGRKGRRLDVARLARRRHWGHPIRFPRTPLLHRIRRRRRHPANPIPP